MNQKIIFLVLFCFCAMEGIAQTSYINDEKAINRYRPLTYLVNTDPDDDHPDYEINRWNKPTIHAKTSEGEEWQYFLDGTHVNSTVVTDSVMWVGTQYGGLVKIDRRTGEKIFFNRENSPLAENTARSMLLDSKGSLWVTSHRQLLQFDGTTWRQHVIKDEEGKEMSVYITSQLIEDLEGTIWVVGSSSIARFDGANWEIERPLNTHSYRLKMASDGTLWMTCGGGKLLYYKHGIWKEAPNFNVPIFGQNGIDDFVFDEEGKLWIIGSDKHYGSNACRGSDLVVYDGTEIVASYSWKDGTLPGCLSNIKIDGEGTMWFSSLTECNRFYSLKDDVFTTVDLKEQEFCLNNKLRFIGEDCWIRQKGVVERIDIKTGGVKESHVVTNAFLLQAGEMVVDINNKKWFISAQGYDYLLSKRRGSLIGYDGKNWENHALPDNHYPIEIIVAKDGGIYMHSYMQGDRNINVLHYFNDNKWELVSTEELDGTFGNLVEDETGRLWLTSEMKIAYREGGRWILDEISPIENENQSWFTESFSDLVVVKGNQKWAVTNFKRVFKYNDSSKTWEYQLTLDEDDSLLGESFCYGYNPPSLYTDSKGNIWANGERFLAKYDGNDWEYFLDDEIDMGCGVYDLEEDLQGNIWVNVSRNLVYKYDGIKWEEINAANSGLYEDGVNDIEVDHDGNIWFVRGTSISVFQAGGGVGLEGEEEGLIDKSSHISDLQLSPNPLVSNTPLTISFDLLENAATQIAVYNSVGQQVFVRDQGQLVKGEHRFELNTSLSMGWYLLSIQTDKGQMIQSFIVHE